jgi:DNA-binding CsgD family transcriptional regulator
MHDLRAPYIIGRDRELEELQRALGAARDQSGRTVFVVGDEGSGKSRLVRAATADGRAQGMRACLGRAGGFGPPVALRPLTEALFGLMREGAVPAGDALGSCREALSRPVPGRRDGALLGLDGLCSHLGLAETILRLFAAAGRERGCLLVLEDLHVADALTLAVLEYLADNLAGQPVALVATIDREPSEALELARAEQRRGDGALLELGALARADVRRLAEACLDTDPGGVPGRVVDLLWQDSAGNPRLVEDILAGLVEDGTLVRAGAGGWRLAGEPRTAVPESFAHTFRQRVRRLGPGGQELLSAAAVLGRRFPLAVAAAAAGLAQDDVQRHARAAVAAGLLDADDASDWYAFGHPLAVRAALAVLVPAERAALARAAFAEVERRHPDLPGQWCDLAVALRTESGDPAGAARLLCRAGGRLLAAGTPGPAVAMFERALGLVAAADDSETALLCVGGLAESLIETGEVTRARSLAATVDELCADAPDMPRLAALRCRIGWAAILAGRCTEAAALLVAARETLGSDPPPSAVAAVDILTARLAWRTGGPGRHQDAEEPARHAESLAEVHGLGAVGCEAWHLLGVLAAERGSEEAAACFARVRALAQEHRLPLWRVRADTGLGAHERLATGDAARLARSRRAAARLGATAARCEAEANLALQRALCGNFGAAEQLARQCRAEAARLDLADTVRLTLLSEVVLAALQGRRQRMDPALEEFRQWGGEESALWPLACGLALPICALLEEDRVRARAELAVASADGADGVGGADGGRMGGQGTVLLGPDPLLGDRGLRLLLDALHGDLSWQRYEDAMAAPSAQLRWNRQFALLARAVQLGREGRARDAAAAVAKAGEAAVPYRTSWHLGLRLVAEAALADRWGDPWTWLRRAEEHFHSAGVPAVTGACRGLLRRGGVTVSQRRAGADLVPPELRLLGVTAREFEVLELMASQTGNREIAGRLYISPRTVEKHIARLIAKTGQPDRAALHRYSRGTILTWHTSHVDSGGP